MGGGGVGASGRLLPTIMYQRRGACGLWLLINYRCANNGRFVTTPSLIISGKKKRQRHLLPHKLYTEQYIKSNTETSLNIFYFGLS